MQMAPLNYYYSPLLEGSLLWTLLLPYDMRRRLMANFCHFRLGWSGKWKISWFQHWRRINVESGNGSLFVFHDLVLGRDPFRLWPPWRSPTAEESGWPSPNRSDRKAVESPQKLLQCQSSSRRFNERANGGNDRPFSARDPSVVSEQALQGQEEAHTAKEQGNCKCVVSL